METPQPRVCVGIPTYNRCATLRRAVDSALAQDWPSLSILIVDNASTDGTAQLCQELVRADPRVRYHRQQRNVGATANFREALARADGEFFLWLADDDWVDPDFVRRNVEVLIADPAVAACGGAARYYDGARRWDGAIVQCGAASPLARVLAYYRQVEDNAIIYGVLRREMACEGHLLNCIGGDWLFMAGLAWRGKIVTQPATRIHRDAGGSSQERRKMAASLGVAAWEARLPVTLSLAVNAARDVAWRNPLFRAEPPWRRLALLVTVPCCIILFKPAQELARRWRRRSLQGGAAQL